MLYGIVSSSSTSSSSSSYRGCGCRRSSDSFNLLLHMQFTSFHLPIFRCRLCVCVPWSRLSCLLCCRCVVECWARRTGSVRIMLIVVNRGAALISCDVFLNDHTYFGFWCLSHFSSHPFDIYDCWMRFFSRTFAIRIRCVVVVAFSTPISSNRIAQIFSHFRSSMHFMVAIVFFGFVSLAWL